MEKTKTMRENIELKDAKEIPSLFENVKIFFDKLGNRKIILFLDYDGTLSNIVNNPEEAIITPEMKEALKKCADKYKVSVVSGRDMEDVRSKVNLDNVIYAGSHGFRISGPKGLKMRHPESAEIIPNLDDIEEELRNTFINQIDGVHIERKMFAIAVHYRNANEQDIPAINEKITKVTVNHPELKKGKGKKIFEIKPDLNWHKGKAIEWIMDTLKMNSKDTVPVYLGDDVTDEDGFKAIYKKGIGILVGSHGKPTAAQFRLESVDKVKDFLRMMSE